MIVVVGQPYLREAEGGPLLEGSAARIAAAAAQAGHPVQLVGTAGEDEAGDQVVMALARAGIGHVALLRKAGQQTLLMPASEPLGDSPLADGGEMPASQAAPPIALDPGDVELALRYLPDISVLVLAEAAGSDTARVLAQSAQWSDARLIFVLDVGAADLAALPDDAILFEAPDSDPDGDFAHMVGAFAAALDDGDDPAAAFQASISEGGWQPSADA